MPRCDPMPRRQRPGPSDLWRLRWAASCCCAGRPAALLSSPTCLWSDTTASATAICARGLSSRFSGGCSWRWWPIAPSPAGRTSWGPTGATFFPSGGCSPTRSRASTCRWRCWRWAVCCTRRDGRCWPCDSGAHAGRGRRWRRCWGRWWHCARHCFTWACRFPLLSCRCSTRGCMPLRGGRPRLATCC